jgi:UDP-N-acetylglucosamine--N-acetylmuramyl-(pentapeptide) pyrophosphoryl-undecaprenol N-acetylglucosamine transferase
MDTIVFAGGGTGGHIFPGLAIVDELLKLPGERSVVWIGSSSGMDRSIVEGHGVRFIGISTGKLRRYFSWKNFTDLFRIAGGFFSSMGILMRLKPTIVFSKGGFVSVPACLAARILKIPVITHECDFSPGLATRINARVASDVFVSYEETARAFPARMRPRVTVTGNPVRPVFYSASAERGRAFLGCADNALPILLVLGGSLGARQVNEMVLGSLESLCANFIIVHQTGEQNRDQAAIDVSQAVKERYKPYAFIREEMADVLAAAALVVARSGANTVWECAAAGKPMVLVPLEKGSSRGDQVENARYFVSHGAAIMLTGSEATAERLAETVMGLVAHEGVMKDMAQNSAALGADRPAARIAALVAERSSRARAKGKR